ncbi:MAG: hypothetical protein ABIK89_03785 [Planctomycetota bacterium]
MHTVELLEEAITLAEKAGYQVRQEWLGGNGGGDCEIKGQRWIFLDLAVGPLDHLELVLQVLQREPNAVSMRMPHELRDLLALRKSA